MPLFRIASPINDNSSESGSESTSPESSSEESNNGSSKIESATTENSKWNLIQFIKPDVQTKTTANTIQPLTSLDNQPSISTIKNEPLQPIDDEPSNVYQSSSQSGMAKDVYQSSKILYDPKPNPLSNCDISTEQIKQEIIGKFI